MTSAVHKVTRTGKEKTNMRKPATEKMRRDRINTSIEQLKVLLKSDMKAGRPCCKVEKADILEMAVVHLKRHMASPNAATARFLSVHSRTQTTTPAAMSPSPKQPNISTKPDCAFVPTNSCEASSHQTLWRPW